MDGRKICFVGRGGSGKSTCLVLLAHALRSHGRQVCILDCDSTNIGLNAALGIGHPPEPLVGYFGGMVFQGGRITCPVDDPSLISNASIDLDALPGKYCSRNAAGITLLQTGKLADFGPGAGCDGPMVKIARDLKVNNGNGPVDLLVDFKAGLEDTSRGALIGMDALVVVCDPTMAAVQTVISLKRVLDAQRLGGVPSTRHLESPELVSLMEKLYREWRVGHLYVVLNKVPDEDTENFLRGELEPRGIAIAAVVPDKRTIRQAWMRGTELPPEDGHHLDPLVSRLDESAAGALESLATGH